MCPAIEPQETGLTEPWPPQADKTGGKGGEVSVVVVDTGWHPPAATDPRTPWLQGVTGDDELNGPDLRPYAGHGTFIAGVVRCVAPETEDLRRGLRHRRRRRGRDPRVRPRRAARAGAAARPAGHQPLGRLPDPPRPALDPPAEVPPPAPRGARLRARRGRRQRLLGRALLARRLRLVRRRRLARPGRARLDFSNFGVSADVYALGRNLVNAFPDGTFECNETPRQGRHPGVQHRHGAVERHVVLSAGRGRPDRPRDQRDGRVGTRTRATPCCAAPGPDSDPTIGPHQELRQPYPHP